MNVLEMKCLRSLVGVSRMDRVRARVKMSQLLNVKSQVSSIWAKGCMFDICVCVLYDLT